ncbi:MAG TPA: peptidoglycan DD-metalloendopeptidase family protein, partial [Gammaproteobacteria bacterium]|nr:peptidoglycan DD-metalloendopeptidase family protein [Gammaproteobacteria bacterium]
MKDYSGGIRHDYKQALTMADRSPARRWSWFLAGLLLPISIVLLAVLSSTEDPVIPAIANPIGAAEATTQLQLRLPAPNPGASPTGEATTGIELGDIASTLLVVRPGDSLERLFRRHELSLTDLAAMVRLDEAREHLIKLRPGDEIGVSHQGESVVGLTRELGKLRSLSIRRSGDEFVAEITDYPLETRAVGAHGVIDSSLFEAGQAAGISDSVIMDMAGIFQWDIDFIQDVRSGDEFTVIYDELWRDGVKLQDGAIVAAEFINQGRLYRAARYSDPNGNAGYFTPDGRSVRKAFLRAPVDFTRISSNFNPNRRHPVLNTIRAHRGVDYAASTGTPIRAAGDGKVNFRGVNGGYGNTIILQHGGNVTTLYAHMSRFADPKVGAHGVIDSSLFEAGQAAGISDSVIMDMAGIFQWDIDFIQDVREGDEFTVIYGEL